MYYVTADKPKTTAAFPVSQEIVVDPVLSASQPHGSGTNSLSAFAKPRHFLLLNAIL